ncbi:hypothetical protein HDV05_005837, partial [Chytridiales sp. JEL 0842]
LEVDDRRKFALELIFISEEGRRQKALDTIMDSNEEDDIVFTAETMRHIHELTDNQNDFFTKPLKATVAKTMQVVKTAVDETGIERRLTETLKKGPKSIRKPSIEPSFAGSKQGDDQAYVSSRPMPPETLVEEPPKSTLETDKSVEDAVDSSQVQ